MSYYLVRAQARPESLDTLKERLDSGEIRCLRPFGRALDGSLRDARLEPDGTVTWEEEDYCRPPLAMERAAVLDRHFTGIEVEAVSRGEGWLRIAALPSLWGAGL